MHGGSQDIPKENRLPGWIYVKVYDEFVGNFS